MTNRFGKEFKLTGKKLLEEVYTEGQTLKEYPFVVKWKLIQNEKAAIQLALTVPKRNFKLAVTRNLLKRRIREAVRLNKHLLENKLKTEHKQLAIFVIYTGRDVQKSAFIRKKISTILQKLESIPHENN